MERERDENACNHSREQVELWVANFASREFIRERGEESGDVLGLPGQWEGGRESQQGGVRRLLGLEINQLFGKTLI